MRALTMYHRALRQLLSAVFTSLLLTTPAALAQSQGQALLENYTPVTLEELADPPASDWLMWRGTPNHWAYSPLDQINRDNVRAATGLVLDHGAGKAGDHTIGARWHHVPAAGL